MLDNLQSTNHSDDNGVGCDDRRAEPRIEPHETLALAQLNTCVRVVNLSLSGACFEIPFAAFVRVEDEIRIFYENVERVAIVRWKNEDKTNGKMLIGCEWKSLS